MLRPPCARVPLAALKPPPACRRAPGGGGGQVRRVASLTAPSRAGVLGCKMDRSEQSPPGLSKELRMGSLA